MTTIISRCGYRCDLCPAFRANVHSAQDRQRVSDGWYKYFGFRVPPESVACDGCRDERAQARRMDASCAVRPCVMLRGLATCASCPAMQDCEDLEQRMVTRRWVEERFGRPVPEWDYRDFVRPYESRPVLAWLKEREEAEGEHSAMPMARRGSAR